MKVCVCMYVHACTHVCVCISPDPDWCGPRDPKSEPKKIFSDIGQIIKKQVYEKKGFRNTKYKKEIEIYNFELIVKKEQKCIQQNNLWR